jgi:hypothetical protein
MDERVFPRGGAQPGAATHAGSSSGPHRGPRPSHKIFTENDESPADDSTPKTSSNTTERETNLFTKLKKQKLANEKRRDAAKQKSKKSKGKVEHLVREEEKIVEHLTYNVESFFTA